MVGTQWVETSLNELGFKSDGTVNAAERKNTGLRQPITSHDHGLQRILTCG